MVVVCMKLINKSLTNTISNGEIIKNNELHVANFIPSKEAIISGTSAISCTDVSILREGSYELKSHTSKRAALPNFIYKAMMLPNIFIPSSAALQLCNVWRGTGMKGSRQYSFLPFSVFSDKFLKKHIIENIFKFVIYN